MKSLLFYKLKDKFTNVSNSWDKLSPIEKDAISFGHEYVNPEPVKKNYRF